jgi:hypothetical protein
MAYIVADRVKETTTVTGTGPATLAGAASGYRSFASQLSIGDTCAYVIVNSNGSEWETGIGTYSAVNTLTRTTVQASTNANAAVVFTAGVKDVFMGPTADSLVDYNPVTGAISNATWNGSTISTSKGGTGLTTLGTANQALSVNSAGTALEYHTVVGSVASADGSVTVSQTGQAVDLSVAVAAAATNVVVQVRNNTGAVLTKGTVVYINNAIGQLPTVAKALATTDNTSAQTLGMISADLNDNANGFVTIIGLITGINTQAYDDGDQLYLSDSVAGTFTNVKPLAPSHLVYVGIVEYKNPSNGKIFVRVQNGYELDELHDVSAQSPSNGQTIVYNSTNQLWEKNYPSLTNALSSVPVVSGAGNNLTFTAGSGVTSGAGGSLILQAGVQATTGGDGKVVVKQVAGQTSNLQEWQNSSSTALTTIDSNGRIYVGNGSIGDANNAAIGFGGDPRVGFSYNQTTKNIFISSNGSTRYVLGSIGGGSVIDGFAMLSSASLSWSTSLSTAGPTAPTLSLNYDAADTLAQRRSTNAQAFRLYNTYTDASNYERLGITWASNICTIGLQQAGTGSVRSLVIAGANATSGAGGNVTITAGNGSGVGAGGNIILQPGAQGSSGGNGWVKFYDVTGANTRMGAWNNSTQGYGFGWDTQNNGTMGSGLFSSSATGTGYIGVRGQLAYAYAYETNQGTQAFCTNSANSQSRILFVNGTDARTATGSAGLCSYTTGVITVRDGQTAIAGGSLSFPSSTTAFSANTNDLALTASAFQRINCTSAASLTGIAPPSGGTHVDGRMVRVYNVGTANLTLAHNSASSTAANRMFSSTGADIILAPNDYAELIYDATSNGSGAAGWRVS